MVHASLLAELARRPHPLQRKPPLTGQRRVGPDGRLLWRYEREGVPEGAEQSAAEFIGDRVVQAVLERRSPRRVARRAAHRHGELTGQTPLRAAARELLISEMIQPREQLGSQYALVATWLPWRPPHGESLLRNRLIELRHRQVGWVELLLPALAPVQRGDWGWRIHADLQSALGGGELSWRGHRHQSWEEQLLPLPAANLIQRARRCSREPAVLPLEVSAALCGPSGGELLGLIRELTAAAPWREEPAARQARVAELSLAALWAWER